MRKVWLKAGGVLAPAGLYAILAATPASASTPEEMAACKRIVDGPARLACYDAIALPPAVSAAQPPSLAVPAAAASSPAPAPMPPPAPGQPTVGAAAETASATGFGAEVIKPKIEGPDTLVSRALGKIEGLHRGIEFELDNGQVWTDVDDHPYDDYEAQDPGVRIRRNFLGNYWMLLAGAGSEIRVRRIK